MNRILFILLFAFSIKVSAQAPNGQFIKSLKTGCKIWSEVYSPNETVTWNGACKNGYADGNGILRWQVENKLVSTYTGYMKLGKPNGIGKYQIDGYATMQGNFTNGVLNGKGAIYFLNGGKFIGNFNHGEFLNLDNKYLPLLQKHDLNIVDTTGIYNDGINSPLHYTALVPKGNIKAVLVLFPSTGESVTNVINCNKLLMQQAFDQGIMSIIPSINYNKSLDSDPLAMKLIEQTFQQLISRFNAPKNKFILMGFSLGGENALLYTEMSRNPKYQTLIKPLGVVGVDPPVDLADLYHRAKKQISIYDKEGDNLSESKKIAQNENHFLINHFHKEYGGSPEQFPERYIEGSPYSIDQADGGNAKYLIDVPVRLYCDPDIVWQLKNKGRDYYQMNAAALSSMCNFLIQNGNKRAEFIPAIGKGFRVDGLRHPHSWSIVEPTNCIQWVLNLIK